MDNNLLRMSPLSYETIKIYYQLQTSYFLLLQVLNALGLCFVPHSVGLFYCFSL